MKEIKKEENGCGLNKFIVGTNEGKFEIDLSEDGDLYIGLYDKEHMGDEDVSFVIDKEDMTLYTEILKRYNQVMQLNPYGKKNQDEGPIVKQYYKERAPITDGKVDWASDEMDLDVASHFIIEKDDNENFIITFKKSKAKNSYNTYFVKVSEKSSRYYPFNSIFLHMHKSLERYEVKHKQIAIEEYLYASSTQRVRTSFQKNSHK